MWLVPNAEYPFVRHFPTPWGPITVACVDDLFVYVSAGGAPSLNGVSPLRPYSDVHELSECLMQGKFGTMSPAAEFCPVESPVGLPEVAQLVDGLRVAISDSTRSFTVAFQSKQEAEKVSLNWLSNLT
jgi:hypothetical protein